MQEVLQYLFSGITSGAIYAIIALGFSMLYMATDLINFAQGEFVMLGALGFVSLWSGLKLPLIVAFVLSVLLVTVVGFLFERLAIRPVRRPQPITLIIITVGASIFLRGVAMIVWGKDSYSVAAFSSSKPLELAGATVLPQSLWIVGIVLVLMIALQLFYQRTIVGKAMQACAINRQAAWLLGIPSELMVLLAFGLSAAAGGVGGVIISPITMCSYDMGTVLGLRGFCAAMLGGLGSTRGAVVGGFLLGILEAFGVGFISSSLKDAIAFLLLLLILYIRPSGLLGSETVHRF